MPSFEVAICIPTYNRAPMLRYVLNDIKTQSDRLDLSGFVIVVCDNASTDDTPAVLNSYNGNIPLKIIRQPKNVGGYNNLMSVYKNSDANFCVYCADDDKVDLSIVLALYREISGMEDVGAIYCPWMIESGATGQRSLSFFNTIENTRIRKGCFADGFKIIVDNHLFPEIAIFRTSAVAKLPAHSNVAFWFFLSFPQVLANWDIVIKNKNFAYYTSFLDHPAGKRSVVQMGNEESAQAWDTYRGGLEVFLLLAVQRGQMIASEQMRYVAYINDFVSERQRVAMRSQARRGNFIDAFYIACRIKLHLPHHVDENWVDALRTAAAIEYCYKINFDHGDDRAAYLVGTFPKAFGSLLQRFGPAWFLADNYEVAAPRIAWDQSTFPDQGVTYAAPYVEWLPAIK